MSFKIPDQGEAGVIVNGQDLLLGADGLKDLSVIESVHATTPAVSMTFLDTRLGAASAGLFQDGSPITVALGDGHSNPLQYAFRQWSMENAKINTAGSVATLHGMADVVPWLSKVITKSYTGNSSDIAKQLATESGITLTDVDATQDKMKWLADGRTVAQFVRNMLDRGWMGASSAPHMAVTSQNGQWMMRIKDILKTGSGTQSFASAGLQTSSDIIVWDHNIITRGGPLNTYVNYGHKVVQEMLSGQVNIWQPFSFGAMSSAIGISSALQSAVGLVKTFYHPPDTGNCQTGDTLIATENGLIRIDQLFSKDVSVFKKGNAEHINIMIAGRYKPQRAKQWFFVGKCPTLNIITDTGNELHCTYRHPNLMFDESIGENVWKKSSDCKIGDMLCINPVQITRNTRLKLTMEDLPYNSNRALVRKPKFMNTDLAQFIGYTISEGNINSKYTRMSNSDCAIIKRYGDISESIFGRKICVGIDNVAGDKTVILGVETAATKTCYGVSLGSQQIVHYLKQLGVSESNSHFKQVPWSILQADGESQLAFLAAYLEGDGNIDNNTGRISWYSSSDKLLHQMQIMLNSHGYSPSIRYAKTCNALYLNSIQSMMLWHRIKKYMVTKKLNLVQKTKKLSIEGVPSKYWIDLIRNRCIKTSTQGKSLYLNDAGEEVQVSWVVKDKATLQNILRQSKKLLYATYESGKMTEFLDRLKIISESAHAKLVNLLKLRYTYTAIKNISKGPTTDVYDISMGDQEPAFVANGLIVHNTHANYAQALHNNKMARATFSTTIEILTDTLSSVKLLDDVTLKLAGMDGTQDQAFSGNYKVSGITRHIAGGSYREKLTLTSQGMSADPAGGGV